MRVLFICQFFAPDITAAAFRMSDLAKLLAEAGDDVRVITTYPHKSDVTQVDDSPYRDMGIDVQRCHVQEVVGSGARAYLRHYLSFLRGSLRLGFRLWRSGWRPDLIYASSPPLFVGLSGRALSVLFRCPMVFEVRDIWPDAAVSAGQLSADGWAYRLGQWMERYLYRKAAQMTCVARPMQQYLQQHTRVPVTVIYNGIWVPDDSERDNPGTADLPAVDDVQSPNTKTVLYAGNLGHVQQLDLLLEGIAQLTESGQLTSWHFEFLGGGAQWNNLTALAKQLGVDDHVTFTPPVSREEAARKMRAADLLYLHLMGDATMEQTIPSKLFDYLLAGRPILAGLAGEGAEILRETGANVVFTPGSLEELKSGLQQATQNWSQRVERSAANRQLVLSRFTRQQSAQTLRKVFQTLILPNRN